MQPRVKTGVLRHLRRFAIDGRGVAAVEFAYIAPLLILALFGTIEVSRAVMMHKRFQRVSAMIGDLISREDKIGSAAGEAAPILNGMMLSASQVMFPFSSASLKIEVNSVRAKIDDASQTRSVWYYKSDTKAASSTCATKTMPAGLLSAGNSAIVVDASYTYTPMISRLIPGFKSAVTWTDTITHSPRKGSCVHFESGTECGGCPSW